MIEKLKSGDPVVHNWRTINEVAAQLNANLVPDQQRNAAIAGLRQRPRDVAGGGTTECYRLTIVSIAEEYLTCTDGDDTFYVAKWPENRQTFTAETIDGVDFTYDYSSANLRTSDDGDNSQSEVLYRRYVAGQVIFAIKVFNGTDVTGPDAVEIDYVELAPHVWLRKYIQ